MEFKKALDNWKSILALVTVVAAGTYSIISWAEEQQVMAEAKQQLIHSEMYLENRKLRKSDEIKDLRKDRDRILYYKGAEALTPLQEKEITIIDSLIKDLNKEIEEIDTKLNE